MNYNVKYDRLNDLHTKIGTQKENWSKDIHRVISAIEALSSSSSIEGEYAESVKNYFQVVHGSILSRVYNLIQTTHDYYLIYKTDYMKNVDSNNSTVIETAELEDIRNQLRAQKQVNEQLASDINRTLDSIRGIYSVKTPSMTTLNDCYQRTVRLMDDLEKAVKDNEGRHIKSDFDKTIEVETAIRRIIAGYLSSSRSFVTDFNVQDFISSPEYGALYDATIQLRSETDSRQAELSKAYEIEKERLQLLEEERAEREKKAKLMKLGVMVLSVAAAVVISAVVPGGAVLVLAAASAIRGAATSGLNSMIDAWADDGEISREDWKEVGKDAIKGGVISGVSSIVGSAVTSITDNTVIGSTILSSKNEIVRVGAGAVIGSTRSITSGVVSRGVGEVVDEIMHGEDLSWSKIKEKAFDSKKILHDGITGGASGGISEGKRFDKEMNNEIPSRKEIIENEGMTPREYTKMETAKAKERIDQGLDPQKNWYEKTNDYITKNPGKSTMTVIDAGKKAYEISSEDTKKDETK